MITPGRGSRYIAFVVGPGAPIFFDLSTGSPVPAGRSR
jgi:hypothetical protein